MKARTSKARASSSSAIDRQSNAVRLRYWLKKEAIVTATPRDATAELRLALTAEGVLAVHHLARRIPVSQALVKEGVTLVRQTSTAVFPAGSGGQKSGRHARS